MRKLFAVHLNPSGRGAARRFALYQPAADGSLDVLWGSSEGLYQDPTGDRFGRFPHMIYSAAPNLPAFHFKVTPEKRHRIDGTEDALCDLANALARHWSEPVSIQLLNGWNGFTARSSDCGKV